MRSRVRSAALVYVSYWGAAATMQALWAAGVGLTPEIFVRWVFVPTVQVALLAFAYAVQRWVPGPQTLSPLSSFFVGWLVLTGALILATLGVSVGVFHTVDLTELAVFSALAIPAVQALVLVAPAGGLRDWRRISTDVIARPLARPFLWLDVIMLTLGLAWFQNSRIGIARAPIQRHWVGTKLIAAALFFAVRVRGAPDNRVRVRVRFGGLAAVLLAVGVNAFWPWILALAGYMPTPVDRQPLPVVWLELYAAVFMVVLMAVLSCVPTIERASAGAARLATSATVMLFVASLAIVTNGVFSLQPVLPWAPIAVMTASAAATLFAWAAILSSDRERTR